MVAAGQEEDGKDDYIASCSMRLSGGSTCPCQPWDVLANCGTSPWQSSSCILSVPSVAQVPVLAGVQSSEASAA